MKKILLLFSLMFLLPHNIAAQEKDVEKKVDSFLAQFEQEIGKTISPKDKAIYKISLSRIMNQVDAMGSEQKQAFFKKIVEAQPQEWEQIFADAFGKDITEIWTHGDVIKIIAILKIPYGEYFVPPVSRVITFLNNQRKCLEGVTCSGRKLLLMNYLFGMVVHEITGQHKSLQILGGLNNIRKTWITLYPDMPIPGITASPEGTEVFKNIGKYLQASWSCLVTGAGCSMRRRAAMYFMLGFWSAKTMHYINWNKWIKRLSEITPTIVPVPSEF